MYGEMRIETHHVFKVSVFATQVKIKVFQTYLFIFKNITLEVF